MSETKEPEKDKKRRGIKSVLNSFVMWLSDHRWLFCMKPKGWTERDEAEYLEWENQQPNWRSLYTPKDNDT
jgi:hypothetical protein